MRESQELDQTNYDHEAVNSFFNELHDFNEYINSIAIEEKTDEIIQKVLEGKIFNSTWFHVILRNVQAHLQALGSNLELSWKNFETPELHGLFLMVSRLKLNAELMKDGKFKSKLVSIIIQTWHKYYDCWGSIMELKNNLEASNDIRH